MGDESIQVAPTTVRVPVRTGHSESVNIEFHHPISVEQAKGALAKAPGVVLLDGYAPGSVPTPLHAEDKDDVFVGRVRKDPTVSHGLQMWVVSDNLRKGAATNAVQIAEELIRLGVVPA
jgi:aspartate-semialdehyde dehydrogenase